MGKSCNFPRDDIGHLYLNFCEVGPAFQRIVNVKLQFLTSFLTSVLHFCVDLTGCK